MTEICLAGVGGPAGIGFYNCIKDKYKVYGYDQSPWGEKIAEAAGVDVTSTDPNMHDMLIPIPDPLVKKYAGSDICFLPTPEEVRLCQDKARSAEVLKELAPKVYWVRDTHGAGGKGAQMASEFLPGKNVSVEMIWWQGKLMKTFMKERLSYKVGYVEHDVRGTGSSAVSRCIWDSDLEDLSVMAVTRVSDNPHGIFSIDFKYNEEGEPKITEINPGRFLTASYDFFKNGYNLPLYLVNLYLTRGEEIKLPVYPLGKTVIRQVGQESWYGNEDTILYPKGW